MKPFFSYYGSKYRLCQKGFYPAPKSQVVIEPFAGSATYSTYHEVQYAVLIDKNPMIIDIWNYLIHASEDEIQALPTFGNHGTHTFDEFDKVMNEQTKTVRNLIGFWISKASPRPGKNASSWLRRYADSGTCMVWNEKVKKRIISQLPKIRKWRALVGDYTVADQLHNNSTIFIDPPYSGQCGKDYTYSEIDYLRLKNWINGKSHDKDTQIITCENENLTYPWANFAQTTEAFNMRGKTLELVCVLN